MEKSNSYYQRIFERFSNKAALSQSEEYRKTNCWARNPFSTTEIKEENELVNYYAKFVSNTLVSSSRHPTQSAPAVP